MDKKCCLNCGHNNCDKRGSHKMDCCEDWQRNPDLWLDLLPEKKGWYWWKSSNQPGHVCISIYIKENEKGQKFVIDRDSGNDVEDWGGIWQGPIIPKE